MLKISHLNALPLMRVWITCRCLKSCFFPHYNENLNKGRDFTHSFTVFFFKYKSLRVCLSGSSFCQRWIYLMLEQKVENGNSGVNVCSFVLISGCTQILQIRTNKREVITIFILLLIETFLASCATFHTYLVAVVDDELPVDGNTDFILKSPSWDLSCVSFPVISLLLNLQ